jgi:hypothetical protein
VLLNNSPPTKALRNKNSNSAASAESQKYFVYDTLLEHSRFRVGQFLFSRELPAGSASSVAAIAEKPRKVSFAISPCFWFLVSSSVWSGHDVAKQAITVDLGCVSGQSQMLGGVSDF